VPPFRDEHWARQAALIEEKLRTAVPEPLHIPMNPPLVPLDFDPLDLSRETQVDPREVIADLGSEGIFRQTFLSRCDGLRMVEVQLATRAPSARGALVLEVVESSDGAEVARSTVPRSELTQVRRLARSTSVRSPSRPAGAMPWSCGRWRTKPAPRYRCSARGTVGTRRAKPRSTAAPSIGARASGTAASDREGLAVRSGKLRVAAETAPRSRRV
jgi:hypothetical protein